MPEVSPNLVARKGLARLSKAYCHYRLLPHVGATKSHRCLTRVPVVGVRGAPSSSSICNEHELSATVEICRHGCPLEANVANITGRSSALEYGIQA